MEFHQPLTESDNDYSTGEPSCMEPTIYHGPQRKKADTIKIVPERDALITGHGMEMFQQQYLLPGETPQLLYARVAAYLGSNSAHAQRIYDYISKSWFSPATPILSNAGTKRGLTISCFLQHVEDSMESIAHCWNEQVWLAARGGGIGSYYGEVRSQSESVGAVGKTSGIVPFLKVNEAITLAISQGSLRRGNAAMYLPIWHPEIEEFLGMRNPTGGDPMRKTLQLHHAVLVDDKFMHAVENNTEYNLLSPKTNATIKTVNARELWIKLLITRLEHGEPYIVYIDSVNRARPIHHEHLGLKVCTSNLCSEITLPTGKDYKNKPRTAVCCLSSLNLEKWHEWHKDEQFITDVMEFLDNTLTDFIENAPENFDRATYSAKMERSVGLGVMGFHSFLQQNNVPWESAVAKSWNFKFFKHISEQTKLASKKLAQERGACPDAIEYTHQTGKECMERFSYKIAVAPTASISILSGQSSPGIEPTAANIYKGKILAGDFIFKNKDLEKLLESKGKNTSDVWLTIGQDNGSVQSLDFLTKQEKLVYKTAMEIDQNWLIEFAADRAPYIDQSQSLNIFLPNNTHKKDLHKIHLKAWKMGVKSLYYCRSNAAKEAFTLPSNLSDLQNSTAKLTDSDFARDVNENECLACQ